MKKFQKLMGVMLIFSLLIMIACEDSGSGSSGGGGGGVTPDYSNPGLPLTETQDWLIMYYCDGDNNLEEDLMNDLNEMESIDLSAKNIKIVALVDRHASYYTGSDNWSDTRVYEVKYDSSGYNNKALVSERLAIESLGIAKNASKEINMGDGATVTKFIEFCMDNYPADHTMLLFSNHGGGWRENPVAKKNRLDRIGVTKAVCWDETNGDACLYTSELRTSISAGMGVEKLDIIAFDACLMAMVEIAYELKDVADYMVASEETIPAYGYPYTQIFQNYADTHDAISFGESICVEYYDAYINGDNVEGNDTDDSVTLSLIDLTQISALTTAINSLGSALDTANGNNPNMDKRLQSESFAVSDYVDIKDYCTKETQCTTQRNAVNTAFDNAVIYNKNGTGNSGANGLSIFMPIIWTGDGEQGDYNSTNIQFATAAGSWRTYLTTITSPTATDGLETEEAYYGGGVPVFLPTAPLTGYMYFNGDEDQFFVYGDGTFNLAVSGASDVDVDCYIINKTTGNLVSYEGYINSGGNLDLIYNSSVNCVLVYIYYGTFSTTNPYILTFTNN